MAKQVDKHSIAFAPNQTQRGFIESQATADLFSSRVGEGKSTALAWSIFRHSRMNPGASWAVIRDTYENIRRSTQKTFFEWFPVGVFGEYKETTKEYKWFEGTGCYPGSVTFIGMDSPDDASKLLSWELGGFAMDEPAPAAGSKGIDENIFDLAMTRLRQPGNNWYSAKLATNNPDEDHWTYRKFVNPGAEGFRIWQPPVPENMHNLPPGYYENMRRQLAHRPDLVRRFVDGEFGFQLDGRAVTPQWNDKLHLANGLYPLPGVDLHLLWDFGHNPTCIVTQVTPLGHWHILDSMVGDGIGVEELIEGEVVPLLADRYGKKYNLRHIGDHAGQTGEQTSIRRSAVGAIRNRLGGSWRSGPVKTFERIDPLQGLLSRNINGKGIVQVDRQRASHVHFALRGGWHYHVAATGLVSTDPRKDKHSHPGDAMGYGAAILFPMGRLGLKQMQVPEYKRPGYFGSASSIPDYSNITGNPSRPPVKHGAIL
jgi:hypothetical protein